MLQIKAKLIVSQLMDIKDHLKETNKPLYVSTISTLKLIRWFLKEPVRYDYDFGDIIETEEKIWTNKENKAFVYEDNSATVVEYQIIHNSKKVDVVNKNFYFFLS